MIHSESSPSYKDVALPRIAVFGPKFSGKTTLIWTYAEAHPTMETFRGWGRAVIPGAAPVMVGAHESGEGGVRIATFPGMVFGIEDWEQMLTACDRVLVTMDSQAKRMQENAYYLSYLRQHLRPGLGGCFTFSKSDLPATLPSSEACLHLGIHDGSFPSDWPIFSSTTESTDTLLAPLNYLAGLSL